MIRDAAEFDSDSINELSEYLGYEIVSNETSHQRIKKILINNTDKILVFEKNKKVIGWIHAAIENRVASSTFVEIVGLVVSPDFRRAGVATELVKSVEGWAKSLNLKIRVRSNLIREETHKFYESIGFVKRKSQHVFEKNL